MTAARDELHRLVEQLPDNQVEPAVSDLRRRLSDPAPIGDWRPEFFGIVDGTDTPRDVAANVDLYLAVYGFGRDSV